MTNSIVVVGAGHAGLQMVDALRREGYGEELVLLGNEEGLPYHRPPLSKDFLTKDQDEGKLSIRASHWFQKNEVSLYTGANFRVTQIDPRKKMAVCSGGTVFAYDKLVFATGSRARELDCPGKNLAGIHYLRSKADALALRKAVATASHIMIVGGGFVGLEFASAARSLGRAVTILESQERLMSRVTQPVISDFFFQRHRAAGIDIRLMCQLASIEGEGRVRGVVTAAGEAIAADLVLIAIGNVPNQELAASAGLACENGILVDAQCRTEDASIFAIGDCSNHPNPWFGGRSRLESIQNATDQPKVVAAAIMGKPRNYDALPWFWSDQCGTRLQMAGRSFGWDEFVVRGNPERGSFSVFYFSQGKLLGVDSVAAQIDHVAVRKMLSASAQLTPAQAADPAFALK